MSVFIKMLRFIRKNFDIGIADTFHGKSIAMSLSAIRFATTLTFGESVLDEEAVGDIPTASGVRGISPRHVHMRLAGFHVLYSRRARICTHCHKLRETLYGMATSKVWYGILEFNVPLDTV